MFAPLEISDMDGMFLGLEYPQKKVDIVKIQVEIPPKPRSKAAPTIEDRYVLEQRVKGKWEALDNLLESWKSTLTKGLSFPLDIGVPPKVSAWYDYTYQFRKELDARRILGNAQAAFYCAIAFVSYLTHRHGISQFNAPDYIYQKLDSFTLTLLQNSCICRKVKRVGAYVDTKPGINSEPLRQWAAESHLRCILKASHVPLWFDFGTNGKLYELCFPEYARWRPTREQAAAARVLGGRQPSNTPRPTAQEQLAAQAPSAPSAWGNFAGTSSWGNTAQSISIAELDLATNRERQRILEKASQKPIHPTQYFAEQEELRRRKLETETAAERQLREEIEGHAATTGIPQKGHMVYEWVETDDYDEADEVIWKKEIVGKARRKKLWLDTSSKMRRFHYFRKCWDVWTGLDPDWSFPDDEYNEERDRTYPMHLASPPRRSPSPLQPQRRSSRSSSPARDEHRQGHSRQARRRDRSCSPRRARLRSRSRSRYDRRRSRSRSPRHDRRRSRSRSPRHDRRRSRSRSPRHRYAPRPRSPHVEGRPSFQLYRHDQPRLHAPSHLATRLLSPGPSARPPSPGPSARPPSPGPSTRPSSHAPPSGVEYDSLLRTFVGEADPDYPRREVEPIATVLRSRYGLISGPYAAPVKNDSYMTVKLAEQLLFVDFASDRLPSDLEEATCHLLQYLLKGIPPPLGLSDLLVEDPQLRLRERQGPMQVIVADWSFESEEGEIKADEPSKACIIRPRHLAANLDFQWQLVVHSSATAAQILRCAWGPNKIRVIEQLVQRGIPFRTVLQAPLGSTSITSQPVDPLDSGLGWRPRAFVSSPYEYILYEKIREEFLQQADHAKVALASGGIIWRLCIDYLEVQSAFRGPEATAEHQRVVKMGEQRYVYDVLSKHEEELICGVYKLLNSAYMRLFVWLIRS
jgi:hypothetical protein